VLTSDPLGQLLSVAIGDRTDADSTIASGIRSAPSCADSAGEITGRAAALTVADRLGAVTGVSSGVNSQETARMDYQQALKNPGKMFRMPEDLEASAEFDAAQKRAILLQWKDQLMQLQRATNENMPGPESDGAGAECLRRVVDALIRIDGASARKP